jgi:Domain of unknown function (DUF4190)
MGHLVTGVAQAATNTNGPAVISLAAGILGWTLLFGVATPVAIVMGHMARKQIRQTGQPGDGFAITGLLLGYLQVAIGALILFLVTVVGVGLFAAFSD